MPCLPPALLLLGLAPPALQEPALPPPVPTDATAAAPATAAGEPRVLDVRLADVVAWVEHRGTTLEQARFRTASATAGIRQAQGDFDPVLFGDLTYTFSERPAGGFFSAFGNTTTKTLSATQGLRQLLTTGGTMELRLQEQHSRFSFLPLPQSDTTLTFQFDQPLLRGAWRLVATEALERARLQAHQSDRDLQQARNDRIQDALDAYWELALARADLAVKERSLELARELREMSERRFRLGAIAEVEVIQAEADVTTRADAVLTAANRVRDAEDALKVLVFGLDEAEEWDFGLRPVDPVPEVAAPEVDWRTAFARARRLRPDLQKLRLAAEEAELAWRSARRGLLPKLDFTAQGSYFGQEPQVGDSLSTLFQRDFPGYTLGLVFELPIGNDTARGAERVAHWNHQLALRALKDRERDLAREVRQAVREVAWLAERVAATREAREVAERQLAAEQRRLEEGASTNFQVLQFQTDLAAAESAEVQALMDYAKAVYRLNVVQGLEWDGSLPRRAEEAKPKPPPAASDR